MIDQEREDAISAHLAEGGSMNRRSLMKAFGAAAFAASPLLTAACGSDSGSSTTKAAATTAADKAGASQLGASLKDILGDPGKLSTVGQFDVTGVWPLTGQGSVYGDYQTKGWELGVKHVKEWSGLEFKTATLDHQSGNPQAGAAAARKAGASGSPIFPSSYIFVFGAIAPGCKQYKLLSLDAGGGTGPAAKGLPYCYGFRAGWPQDPQPGMTKLLREMYPDKRRWAVVSWDAGATYLDPLKADMQKIYGQYDVELATFQPAKIGDTNYDSVIQKVKEAKPDVIALLTGGTDCGYQAKAIQRAGIDATVVCSEFTPDAVKIAGDAYKDWFFGYDFLNVDNPTNDWTKIFVDAFREEYDKDPINYAAAYYAEAFAYAELMRRILEKGGDLKDGAQYITALESNPTFPHVYGGKGKEPGKLTIDVKTHTPAAIPMIGFQSDGKGGVKELLTYDINAKDYTRL